MVVFFEPNGFRSPARAFQIRRGGHAVARWRLHFAHAGNGESFCASCRLEYHLYCVWPYPDSHSLYSTAYANEPLHRCEWTRPLTAVAPYPDHAVLLNETFQFLSRLDGVAFLGHNSIGGIGTNMPCNQRRVPNRIPLGSAILPGTPFFLRLSFPGQPACHRQ